MQVWFIRESVKKQWGLANCDTRATRYKYKSSFEILVMPDKFFAGIVGDCGQSVKAVMLDSSLPLEEQTWYART